MSRVLVTGGTGVLGRKLVKRLLRDGYTVRVLSRRSQRPDRFPDVEWASGNLGTGTGLAEAVSGAEVILHAATKPFRESVEVGGTARLVEQARAAGAAHFVYISIVGTDRIPLRYYRQKLAAEKLIEQAGVPWSILRATQFHTLIDMMLQPLRWAPVFPLPTGFRFQPIDAGEVAERLIDCVRQGPAGRLPDLGGPEVRALGELARTWMEILGIKRLVIPLPAFGKVGAAFRSGLNTTPQTPRGKITWADWVGQKYAPVGR